MTVFHDDRPITYEEYQLANPNTAPIECTSVPGTYLKKKAKSNEARSLLTICAGMIPLNFAELSRMFPNLVVFPVDFKQARLHKNE